MNKTTIKKVVLIFVAVVVFSLNCTICQQSMGQYVVVLGTLQDAGSPHIGCNKDCCKDLFENFDETRKVSCLAIVDDETQSLFLVDATPDISTQVRAVWKLRDFKGTEMPTGIILTHAHIGHYTGLMYLGREGRNTKNIPTYVMPRMEEFLQKNAPWNLLLNLNNISLNALMADKTINLTPNIKITPILVPHRGEFSETIGLRIEGKSGKILYIPDIDKWKLWDKSIKQEIQKVDIAILDATFYNASEVNNRNISEIPHPFVVESLEEFKDLSPSEKAKVHFIHFNHTNPLLKPTSEESKFVHKQGYNVSKFLQKFKI